MNHMRTRSGYSGQSDEFIFEDGVQGYNNKEGFRSMTPEIAFHENATYKDNTRHHYQNYHYNQNNKNHHQHSSTYSSIPNT